MLHPTLLGMYLVWDIEWENDMVILIFTTLLMGAVIGGGLVYLSQNRLRTKEMNKINELTEAIINDKDLKCPDIGKETLYSKIENQLIRIQEILDGRRKEAEKSQVEIIIRNLYKSRSMEMKNH